MVDSLVPLRLKDLQPGDVILSRAKFLIEGGWESALIVWLDGGRYSHAAVFNGHAFVEMIGVGIVASAPRVKTHVHRYSHVYRFHDRDGREMDGDMLPAAPVVAEADGLLNTVNRYGYAELLMVAVVIVLRGAFMSRRQRAVVEVLGGVLLTALKRLIDDLRRNRTVTLTCTELIARCFWRASDPRGTPYGVLIRLFNRHRGNRDVSDRMTGITQALTRELMRLDADWTIALTSPREPNGVLPETLIAGSPLLPANCVTPCDLERSPSLRLLGRYVEGA